MFDTYQKQAVKTFKPHTPLNAHQARLLNWALGLSGETGEVVELIKHNVFSDEPLDKMKLAKELGDILWYVSAMAETNDIKLSAIAELNANKLAHRYGGDTYSDSACRDRHEAETRFEDTFIYKCMEAKILGTPAPLNVIFVGPDGAGKTTIAKLVTEQLEGFTYHKCDYRQDDKPNLAAKLLAEQTNVIYDRFYYPDDIIYSRVQHEKTSEEEMDWNTEYWKKYNDIRDTLCELNTVVILVTASPETLQARSKAWKDDYITTDDLHKIVQLYQKWRGYILTLPVVMFDYDNTNGTPEEAAAHLVMCIKRAQAVFANLDPNTFLTDEEKERAVALDGDSN